MDILSLYNDFGIPYSTQGKNTKPGWVNITCPFCDDVSNHLGANIKSGAFNCWKCGPKKRSTAVSKILGVSESEAKSIVRKYKGTARVEPQNEKISFQPFHLPSGCMSLSSVNRELKRHIKYLEDRNFNPDKISQEWGLMGTGPISELDGISYKFRIIAPIYWEGEMVSFQSRDVTGKHKLRYMACPKHREKIHHKDVLYLHPELMKDGEVGICVEGITDVWRLGKNSFCTFGIEFTRKQVRKMKKLFRRVFVLFDEGVTEEQQAKELISELRFRGLSSYYIPMKKDPADMKQDDADHLVRELMGRK